MTEQLCDAVAAAGFELCDLCEAVSRCSAGESDNSIAQEVRRCARARKQVSGVRLSQLDQQPVEPAVVPQQSVMDAVDSKYTENVNEPAAAVFGQQVLELAQVSVHNAVNMCECGACDAMFAVSDMLFDGALCNALVMEAVGVVAAAKGTCKCKDVTVEMEAAFSTMVELCSSSRSKLRPSAMTCLVLPQIHQKPVS